MEKASLMSIKRESVRAIFKSVVAGENISRLKISEETGLSLMTVGKVIDALLELDIVCQVKEQKSVAGRKAGLINLKNDSFMLIIDLTSRDFSMSIVDIKLGVIDKMIYSYNADFYFEENLFIFLKNLKMYLSRRFDLDKFIGTGVVLPGGYDPETDKVKNSRIAELEGIQLAKTLEGALDISISFFEEDSKSAALSNINCSCDDESGVLSYVYVDDKTANAVTVVDGKILYGARGSAGNVNKMLIDGVKTYESFTSSKDNSESFISATAYVLYNLVLTVDPRKIILECERFDEKSIGALEAAMKKLSEGNVCSLPEILLSKSNIKHSHRGIAMKMREMWLEKVIK